MMNGQEIFTRPTKRRLLFSISAMLLSVVLLIVAVFAWFSAPKNSNVFVTQIGDLNLDCEVYVYKNDLTDESELDFGSLSRSEIIDQNFLSMDDAKQRNSRNNGDGSETFTNIHIGKQLRYKIVIINNSLTANDGVVSISFLNMTSYIYQCVNMATSGEYAEEELDEELDEIFGSNSSRLIFNLRNLKTQIYTDDGDGKYNNPVENTATKKFADGTYVPLWMYSRGEAFGENLISGEAVAHKSLLEVDFTLSCDFFTDEITQYINAAPSNYAYLFSATEETLTDVQREAITRMAEKESLYVFGKDSAKLEFTIKGILIRGTQSA